MNARGIIDRIVEAEDPRAAHLRASRLPEGFRLKRTKIGSFVLLRNGLNVGFIFNGVRSSWGSDATENWGYMLTDERAIHPGYENADRAALAACVKWQEREDALRKRYSMGEAEDPRQAHARLKPPEWEIRDSGSEPASSEMLLYLKASPAHAIGCLNQVGVRRKKWMANLVDGNGYFGPYATLYDAAEAAYARWLDPNRKQKMRSNSFLARQ